MKEKIVEALKTLNTSADAQWTQDGLVALNAFKFAMGGESVTREQLEEAAPGFNRSNAEVYFQPKDELLKAAEEIAVTLEEAHIKEGSIEATKLSDSNVVTMALDVNVTLAESLKTLMGIGAHTMDEIGSLTTEQLQTIMKEIPERRNRLISLRNEFEQLLNAELHLLIKLEEAHDARLPKENHADLVKRIHAANMSSKYLVDQPRQRVAPPIPPLKK